jgi:hypothetical protein
MNIFALVVSYNQPRFDQYASWSANAITFADSNTVGSLPYGIFVDTNNAVYAAYNQANGQIFIWRNNSINLTNILSGNLSNPNAIFVTNNADIYVDNGNSVGQVDKWIFNTNTSVIAMYVGRSCYSLFVDINDVLYCSMKDLNQVVTKSLNSASNVVTIVAGTGCNPSSSYMLNQPHGIFVNTNFDLYVADSGNSRIQLFQQGQLNGTTVAGNGLLNTTITLNYPTGIVLDADNYLFIVDSYNNRIVRSGPNGFQCIVGCYGNGSASNQLNNPRMMAFDSDGNIFVTDYINNRIQKFIFINYTLRKCYRIVQIREHIEINNSCIYISKFSALNYSFFYYDNRLIIPLTRIVQRTSFFLNSNYKNHRTL